MDGAAEAGTLSELAFCHQAAERGYQIFLPVGGASKADCIIRKPGRPPIMVQVKTGWWDKKRSRYEIHAHRKHVKKGSMAHTTYSPTDFDVIAGFLPDMGQFVLMPMDKLGSRTKVIITPGVKNPEFKVGDWSVLA